eukprot:scaffold487534_cov55-Prasinocladus_malaysianus.AAC.1
MQQWANTWKIDVKIELRYPQGGAVCHWMQKGMQLGIIFKVGEGIIFKPVIVRAFRRQGRINHVILTSYADR